MWESASGEEGGYCISCLNIFKGSFKLIIILLELNISERKEKVFESYNCYLLQPSALHQLIFGIPYN